LAENLTRIFGQSSVFIDTDTIRLANNWKRELDSALQAASVVVVVIGPKWQFLQDADGRRRIDNEDDWVRAEILAGIKTGKTVLPVLVSGATLPGTQALPIPLQPLFDSQAYELNDRYWERDVAYLAKRLEELGIKKALGDASMADIAYPVPIDTSKPLSDSELTEALSRLPGWQISRRSLTEDPAHERVELYKVFKFRSFEDATHFVNTAARFVSMTNHHPDWQNLWVSVRVWLTTWDIGHRPTFKDVRLAEYLEGLYREYTVS
jgi:pterin-4a-carbinolamine dehydratase